MLIWVNQRTALKQQNPEGGFRLLSHQSEWKLPSEPDLDSLARRPGPSPRLTSSALLCLPDREPPSTSWNLQHKESTYLVFHGPTCNPPACLPSNSNHHLLD
ncbi:hypothetical protein AMECASPLE_034979 [Ameca splendens]|uniref:Uncharacterized protein n=1 Tax=Ameca splendens TaxID=208324 RepID=A0ABV0Y7E3_9TELE